MPASGSSTPRSSARRMCDSSRNWGSSPRCSHHTPATTCAGPMLGSGRVDGAYAWCWFQGAQVPLAFGSDFPVEIVNPFWGIYAAITRQDAEGKPPGGWHPEQRLSLEEALRGFTTGAAYAAFAEDRLGIIRTGMQADMTLVDRDLFRASPQELLKSRVVMTIIAGQVAFESPGS